MDHDTLEVGQVDPPLVAQHGDGVGGRDQDVAVQHGGRGVLGQRLADAGNPGAGPLSVGLRHHVHMLGQWGHAVLRGCLRIPLPGRGTSGNSLLFTGALLKRCKMA